MPIIRRLPCWLAQYLSVMPTPYGHFIRLPFCMTTCVFPQLGFALRGSNLFCVGFAVPWRPKLPRPGGRQCAAVSPRCPLRVFLCFQFPLRSRAWVPWRRPPFVFWPTLRNSACSGFGSLKPSFQNFQAFQFAKCSFSFPLAFLLVFLQVSTQGKAKQSNA